MKEEKNSIFAKTDNVFKIKAIHRNENTEDSILIKGEKRFLYMRRTKETERAYSNFLNMLGLYAKKVSSTYPKESVLKLIDRDVILLGVDIDKNLLLGAITTTSQSKLAGILIDVGNIGLEYTTGDTSKINEAFYITYYQYIRAIVRLNPKEIIASNDINDICVGYYKALFIKVLNINFPGKKQKDIYDILVSIFFNVFMRYKSYEFAVDNAISKSKSEYIDEIDDLFTNKFLIKNFTQFRDIFKAIPELGVVSETPNELLRRCLTYTKAIGFYSLTLSLDYAIATMICSLYPFEPFRPLLINKDTQSKLEDLIMVHSKSIEYDDVITTGILTKVGQF